MRFKITPLYPKEPKKEVFVFMPNYCGKCGNVYLWEKVKYRYGDLVTRRCPYDDSGLYPWILLRDARRKFAKNKLKD